MGISKRLAFHTFRHSYTTLLTQNNEDIRLCKNFLAMPTVGSLELYAQSGMAGKRETRRKGLRDGVKKGEGSGLSGKII